MTMWDRFYVEYENEMIFSSSKKKDCIEYVKSEVEYYKSVDLYEPGEYKVYDRAERKVVYTE